MNVQNGRMPGELDRHLGRRIGVSLLLVIGLAVSLFGFVEDASAAQGLRFSLVKTAQSESGDFLLGRDGWQEAPPTQHIAILIEHRGSRLLFGTGLGRQIDAQLDAEVPWRIKRYADVRPVRDQLEGDGLAIDRIVLGCVRWEHASGLVDYPEVPVLASADSLGYLEAATPPAVLPSQFRHPVRWMDMGRSVCSSRLPMAAASSFAATDWNGTPAMRQRKLSRCRMPTPRLRSASIRAGWREPDNKKTARPLRIWAMLRAWERAISRATAPPRSPGPCPMAEVGLPL